jgi:hypothetical protein
MNSNTSDCCSTGQVLDSVPDLDLLVYLPQLLDGLMAMLSDPNREIRVAAHKAMMASVCLCICVCVCVCACAGGAMCCVLCLGCCGML